MGSLIAASARGPSASPSMSPCATTNRHWPGRRGALIASQARIEAT
nr:hypothetical protein [uncultured Duganella sp.]